MATQIKVTAQTSGGDYILFLDLGDNQPLTANYQFKDIQDVKANKGNHTFSFRVPSTPKNNIFFGDYFMVTSFGNYDPRLKADVEILVDDVAVFTGFLQLKNVIVSDGDIANYECVCFNSIASLGQLIEGIYLRDYDWSFYDHDVNLTSVIESMNRDVTPFKNGDIVYSLYDYGGGFVGSTNSYTGVNQPDGAINIKNLKPQMRLKTIWDKILSEAGFTYDSEFIDEEFPDIYMDLNNGTELVSEGSNGNFICQLDSLGNQTFTNGISSHIVQLPDTTSSSYVDNAGQFDVTTGILTPSQFYSAININFGLSLDISTNWTSAHQFKIGLFTESTYGSGVFDVEEYSSPVQPIVSASGTNNIISQIWNNIYIDNTKRYTFKVTQTSYTGSGTITIASAGMNWYPLSSGTQISFNGWGQTNLLNGTYIFDTQFNFGDLKSLDIITSLCKKFNLVIIPDDIETTHLYIEPYKDWIEQGNELNWTSKLDKSRDIQLKPTVDLQAKLLKFEDAESEDLWNVWYNQQSGRRYGSYYLTNESDFGKKVDSVDTLFAPTITRRISDTEIVNAICHGEEYAPVKGNRLSYYCGYVGSGATPYYLTDGNLLNIYNNYALFSNYKDANPTDTTEVLSFQAMPNPAVAPLTIYGAYQVYWKRFIDETYSVDSRLLIATFQLSAIDIMSLNFNDIIFLENEYYRINKINNYPLVGKGTCKVELIKVLRTNSCGVTLYSIAPNGYGNFEDEQTGTISQYISPECCIQVTQDYVSQPINGKCQIYIERPAPNEERSNIVRGGNNAILGNFNSVQGSNNSLTSLNSVSGSRNNINLTSNGVKIQGDQNIIGQSSRNINVVGGYNDISPYALSIDDTHLKVQTNASFKNVIMKGDYGTAISSGANVISGGADDLYNTAGRSASGEFVKILWTDNKQSLNIGQNGEFIFGLTADEFYKDAVENAFQMEYPSFIGYQIDIVGHERGSVGSRSQNFSYRRYAGVIQNTSNSGAINAKEQTIEIQKEGSIFTPYTFSINAVPVQFLSNQYVADGCFYFKLDTNATNLGNVDWTISFKYTLTGLQNMSRSAGSRIFIPTSITGCLLWLDSSDPTTITHSSGVVSQWDDKSGNNHHVSQSDVSKRPTYSQLIYDSYIAFDDQYLRNNDSSLHSYVNANNTIFVVFESNTSATKTEGSFVAGAVRFSSQYNGININATQNSGGGSNATAYWNDTNDHSVYVNTIPVTTKQVVFGQRKGTAQVISDQLGNTNTNANAINVTTDGFNLGGAEYRSSFRGQLDGKIYEVIAYDNDLSTAEIDQVMNYLTTKWNT